MGQFMYTFSIKYYETVVNFYKANNNLLVLTVRACSPNKSFYVNVGLDTNAINVNGI